MFEGTLGSELSIMGLLKTKILKACMKGLKQSIGGPEMTHCCQVSDCPLVSPSAVLVRQLSAKAKAPVRLFIQISLLHISGVR